MNEKAGAWLDTGVVNKDGTPSGASTSYRTEAANGVPLFPQVGHQRRLPPSPSAPVQVEIDGDDGEAVISGTQARMAPGDPRGRRFRVWWIK